MVLGTHVTNYRFATTEKICKASSSQDPDQIPDSLSALLGSALEQ